MAWRHGLEPLRDPRFAWFFAARTITTFGSVMAPVALAFAVLAIDASPVALGQVLAARTIPLIVLLLLGGAIADRFHRVRVLLVSHLALAVTQGTTAYLVLTHQAEIPQLIVLEAIAGILTAVTMPAIMGMVPDVVPRHQFQQANALLAFSRSGLAAAAPAVAGLLVAGLGSGVALAIDAATWLAAAGCLLPLLRIRSSSESRAARGSLASDLVAGWRIVTATTWLWVLIIVFGVLNLINAGAWLTLGPMVAAQTDHLGTAGWGYALSAQAVGMLVASVALMRLSVHRPLLVGTSAMLCMALPLLALAGRASLPVLLLTCLASGIGIEVYGISWQTVLNENIAPDQMSRVMSYDSLGSFVGIPIGQLLVGPLALALGAGPVLVASAVVFVLVVGLALLNRDVREFRRVVPQDGEDACEPSRAGRHRRPAEPFVPLDRPSTHHVA